MLAVCAPLSSDWLMEPVNKRTAKLPATGISDVGAADVDAFAREMRNIVRLEPDPRGRVHSVAPISPPRSSPQRAELADASEMDFAAPGVDRREIRKLRKGEYLVRDRRDLHGLTRADALASVQRSIQNSRHRGHRCVCIIHGRGLHSTGNPPILRARVRSTFGRIRRSSHTRTRQSQTAVRAPFSSRARPVAPLSRTIAIKPKAMPSVMLTASGITTIVRNAGTASVASSQRISRTLCIIITPTSTSAGATLGYSVT